MNKKTELVQVGRLAFRAEGKMWNAYLARRDTMDGALLLGSIRLTIAQADPVRKQKFMDLMRDVMAEAIKETTGLTPAWKSPQPAPESERGGNA